MIEGANLFLICKVNDEQSLDGVTSLKKNWIAEGYVGYIKKHFHKYFFWCLSFQYDHVYRISNGIVKHKREIILLQFLN